MRIVKNICDICGKEVINANNINNKSLQVNSYGVTQCFDICKDCYEKMEKRKAEIEIETTTNSTWWKEHQGKNGDIDYGQFKSVGNCEQGGIVCPKCKYLNNMYSFKGKCERCGYEGKQ